MKDKLITLDNAFSLLEEINEAYFDIPFTNTAFQTEMFVIASQITPARAWRTIGVNMQSLIETIRAYLLDVEKNKIDIEEIEEEINLGELNKFDLRRKQIKLKELQYNIPAFEKKLKDALYELNLFYKHFILLPKFTRDEFEQQERLYFEQSLQRQILGLNGPKEALVNMNEDKKTIDQFEKMYAELPNEKKKELLDQTIKNSLAGYIQLEI